MKLYQIRSNAWYGDHTNEDNMTIAYETDEIGDDDLLELSDKENLTDAFFGDNPNFTYEEVLDLVRKAGKKGAWYPGANDYSTGTGEVFLLSEHVPQLKRRYGVLVQLLKRGGKGYGFM